MKDLIAIVEDDFWTERLPFFTAQFPTYYRKPQQVHGRIHISEEDYESWGQEIIPVSEKRGIRTYVMMHPYVQEPNIHLSLRLYDKPKHYHDQESPIGEVIGSHRTSRSHSYKLLNLLSISFIGYIDLKNNQNRINRFQRGAECASHHRGFREISLGTAQAWYYHTDKMIVLWECFFDSRFHKHPFATDTNMQQLWQAFERYLVQKFPKAKTLATPFNDPIAASIEEYQSFLKSLGYSQLVQGAFGKKVR